MIVLDSDIVTLLFYGKTDKLQQRMASVQAQEAGGQLKVHEDRQQ